MKPEIFPFAPTLPADWQTALATIKPPIPKLEAVLAWVELDLDANLDFVKSLLLLTEDGLFWTDGHEFETWTLEQGERLVHGDHAGVGHLRMERADH